MSAGTAGDSAEAFSRLYEAPKDADGEAMRRALAANDVLSSMSSAGNQGSLHVDVHLHNAPPGTTATARARGSASAAARVGHANVMGPNV